MLFVIYKNDVLEKARTELKTREVDDEIEKVIDWFETLKHTVAAQLSSQFYVPISTIFQSCLGLKFLVFDFFSIL